VDFFFLNGVRCYT